VTTATRVETGSSADRRETEIDSPQDAIAWQQLGVEDLQGVVPVFLAGD
jgi:hypothetical protein